MCKDECVGMCTRAQVLCVLKCRHVHACARASQACAHVSGIGARAVRRVRWRHALAAEAWCGSMRRHAGLYIHVRYFLPSCTPARMHACMRHPLSHLPAPPCLPVFQCAQRLCGLHARSRQIFEPAYVFACEREEKTDRQRARAQGLLYVDVVMAVSPSDGRARGGGRA
eukprot:364522-Chlamydomonas_euryale.AAC.10